MGEQRGGLHGNDGDDTLKGGEGADTMTGGAGQDSFVFTRVSDSDGSGSEGREKGSMKALAS